MGARKISTTDSIVDYTGVTKKQGVSEERSVTIGDNSGGFILLQGGDFLLQEDSFKFIQNVADLD